MRFTTRSSSFGPTADVMQFCLCKPPQCILSQAVDMWLKWRPSRGIGKPLGLPVKEFQLFLHTVHGYHYMPFPLLSSAGCLQLLLVCGSLFLTWPLKDVSTLSVRWCAMPQIMSFCLFLSFQYKLVLVSSVQWFSPQLCTLFRCSLTNSMFLSIFSGLHLVANSL